MFIYLSVQFKLYIKREGKNLAFISRNCSAPAERKIKTIMWSGTYYLVFIFKVHKHLCTGMFKDIWSSIIYHFKSHCLRIYIGLGKSQLIFFMFMCLFHKIYLTRKNVYSVASMNKFLCSFSSLQYNVVLWKVIRMIEKLENEHL